MLLIRSRIPLKKNRRRNGKPVRARLETNISGVNNTTPCARESRIEIPWRSSCRALRDGPQISSLLIIVSCFSG